MQNYYELLRLFVPVHLISMQQRQELMGRSSGSGVTSSNTAPLDRRGLRDVDEALETGTATLQALAIQGGRSQNEYTRVPIAPIY